MNQPLKGKRVAVLVETEYIYDEVAYYREQVERLGGELDLLTYLWGQPSKTFVNDCDAWDRPITSMHALQVDRCVTQSKADDYDIVLCAANYVAVRLREIQPMGSVGSPDRVNTAPAVKFFADAMANPRIVKGALCHALWILTPNPALLKGRKVICHTVVLADVINAGAIFVPAESHVVVDRDLVTGRSFADVEAYWNAIVDTATKIGEATGLPDAPRPRKSPDPGLVVAELARDTVDYWTKEFRPYLDEHGRPIEFTRPVADFVAQLLALESYAEDRARKLVSGYVRRMTGFSVEAFGPRTVLIAASENGVWASELCIPASMMLAAGYQVEIATETGRAPHMLSVSCDPTFVDGPLGAHVVSKEEAELAARFARPDTPEGRLLDKCNCRSLAEIVRPPLVADYLKDQAATMQSLRDGLMELAEWVRYDALIIAGGSGAVAGFALDGGLQHLVLAFHRAGKPIVAECNGVFALVQAIDPATGNSVLEGKLATTHSKSHEYRRGNWGWTKVDASGNEDWIKPGADGNPIVDSSPFVRNAVGPSGTFYSPPAAPYAVAVDGNVITARTTPDGAPATAALIAMLEGWVSRRPCFAQDETGFTADFGARTGAPR